MYRLVGLQGNGIILLAMPDPTVGDARERFHPCFVGNPRRFLIDRVGFLQGKGAEPWIHSGMHVASTHNLMYRVLIFDT